MRKINLVFVLFLFLIALPAHASASTLYFNAGANNDWNTVTGNWWDDAGFLSQAGALPTVSDDVIISGNVTSNSGPAASVNTMIMNGTSIIQIPVTVANGATFNNTSSMDNVTLTGNAEFNDSSFINHSGIITGDAVYNDSSTNGAFNGGSAHVQGNAIFNDSSRNIDVVEGDAFFHNSSYNYTRVDGNATFFDSSYNFGTIIGDATFMEVNGGTMIVTSNQTLGTINGTIRNANGDPITKVIFRGAYNYGTVSLDAVFEGQGYNRGTITGNVVFNDQSGNYGTINGNVSFFDATINRRYLPYYQGTVNGDACFATTATNSGIVTGAVTVCPVSLPAVTTSTTLNFLSGTSSILNANVTDTGGVGVTVGFDFGLTNTYGSTTTASGLHNRGNSSSTATNLTCVTEYHFRAFVTNSAGTSYGDDATFETSECSASGSNLPSSEVRYPATNSGISGDDETGGPFSLGFNIDFFGQNFNEAYFSTNGTLKFDGEDDDYDNLDLSVGSIGNAVYLFWDDQITNDYENILYTTIGEPGSRKFIAQWTNTYLYYNEENTPLGTYQAILYEGSNDIQIQYRYLLEGIAGTGTNATIGIAKDTSAYSQFSSNTPSLVSGSVVRFISNGDETYTQSTLAPYEPIYLTDASMPDAPILTLPANGSYAVSTTPTLDWEASEGADSYIVTLSTTENFESGSYDDAEQPDSTIIFTHDTSSSTSYLVPTALDADTIYYWFVQAVGPDGTEVSEVHSFYTGILSPLMATYPAVPISDHRATLRGSIANERGDIPTSRGFEYGLTNSYGSTLTQSGSFTAGEFSEDLSALDCDTTYHFRAFATNIVGTGAGEDVTFKTENCMVSGGSSSSSSNTTLTTPLLTPPPTDCKPGDLFSTSTGLPCPLPLPLPLTPTVCTPGALFSTTTGLPCTTVSITTPTTPTYPTPTCSITLT
ncbi:MAG: hypothetical protein ABIS26_01200, partial [Candidatus Paceibacterota bacterium]